MLIGLVGQKRVGKDLCADYLIKHFGFTKTHFADPLKEAVRHIFDLNDEQLYGNHKEIVDIRWNKSPRELFQLFGTDIMRNIMSPMLGLGNEIWVHRFKVWYEKHKKNNVVIADVRFPSEASEIKQMGGILIRIDGRKRTTPHDYHVSEQLVYQIPVDYIIKNDHTKDAYFTTIQSLLEKLTTKERTMNSL